MTQLDQAESDPLLLLAGEVLGDLSNDERQELDALPNGFKAEMLWELERTAAAIELISLGKSESLPPHLLRPLADGGREYCALRSQSANHGSGTPDGSSTQGSTSETQPPTLAAERKSAQTVLTASSPKRAYRELVAWVCCAAAVVLCVTLWSGRSNPPIEPVALTMAEARQAFLVENPDALQVNFVNGPTPFDGEVTGDVVWDNELQSGYMRFKNMPPNDPTVEQYQLWIVDPARDEEPIDGGVFNIGDGEMSVVPIRAKLKVLDPKAFAVTIEKPGGVVVSTQERLPLLAAVE